MSWSGQNASSLDLTEEIVDLAVIVDHVDSFATSDALGIGGLLMDASRLLQIIVESRGAQICGAVDNKAVLSTVVRDAERSLEAFVRRDGNSLLRAADYRLAFREIGLSIGVHALEKMRAVLSENAGVFRNQAAFEAKLGFLLSEYGHCARQIENFWLEPRNRESHGWLAHQDINSVMLATSLAPDGFLSLPSRRAAAVLERHFPRKKLLGMCSGCSPATGCSCKASLYNHHFTGTSTLALCTERGGGGESRQASKVSLHPQFMRRKNFHKKNKGDCTKKKAVVSSLGDKYSDKEGRKV